MPKIQHRKLRFESLAEAMAEAERLSNVPTETSGQYGHGQIIDHLARAFSTSTGDIQPPAIPLPVRIFVRIMRNRMLNQPMSAGFKLPGPAQEFFWSSDHIPVEDAMQTLRKGYARYCEFKEFPKHPLLGKVTAAQMEQFQCRHFELHLGFIHGLWNPWNYNA